MKTIKLSFHLEDMTPHELEALAYLIENFADENESVHALIEQIDEAIENIVDKETAEAVCAAVSDFFINERS